MVATNEAGKNTPTSTGGTLNPEVIDWNLEAKFAAPPNHNPVTPTTQVTTGIDGYSPQTQADPPTREDVWDQEVFF